MFMLTNSSFCCFISTSTQLNFLLLTISMPTPNSYPTSLLHPAISLQKSLDEDDIIVKDNGSLIFNQKIYSVKPVSYCHGYDYEITQNGNARSKGCCGK